MNYIANTADDVRGMLDDISSMSGRSAASIDGLFSDIPGKLRVKSLNLPGPVSELEVVSKIKRQVCRNANFSEYKNFMGGGCYEHYIPPAVAAITGRSDFYTAYTPYQPEVSQGTLMGIFEYQTMICNLTGMEASNASHYDGATAFAESAIMAYNINSRTEFMVASNVNPAYMRVFRTYAAAANFKITLIPFDKATGRLDMDFINGHISDSVSAVMVQNPSFLGTVEEFSGLAGIAHKNGSVFVVSANPVSLGFMKPPSAYGADIVCGEGQPLGIPASFGGPNLGFMATTQKHVRKLPGRIVGETVDKNGKRAFVLTLQAREQHIRRERAASNICSNEALCALAATVYLGYVGPQGLKSVAKRCSDLAHHMAKKISALSGDFEVRFEGSPFFNEFVISFPKHLSHEKVFDHFSSRKILPGVDLSDFFKDGRCSLLVCTTEMRTVEDIDAYIKCLEELK